MMAWHALPIRANQRLRARSARVAIVMAAALTSWTAAADPLVVQGSSTFNRRVMLVHQGAIELASGQTLTVIPSKSTPGLIALFEGRAQLAMISAPLASEIEAVKKIAPAMPCERLQAFEIMATRIAIGVHPSNPVRQASLEEIRRSCSARSPTGRSSAGPICRSASLWPAVEASRRSSSPSCSRAGRWLRPTSSTWVRRSS
jgi:ABC-type phosphate transport system substrate-binding protein